MALLVPRSAGERLVSLDQFRGYTVAGMFLVNFIGGFDVIARELPVLKHHNSYCSYADTIMPQFLFAVGFAFRLTFGRRVQEAGTAAAYGRVVRRLLGLVLVALVVYTASGYRDWSSLQAAGFWGAIGEPLKRTWFQTLMHIAVTSLWVLPVIAASAAVRILFMLASAGLHVFLSWYECFTWLVKDPTVGPLGYFTWVNTGPNGIDGGPLGFLTWAIPLLVGSLACDAVVSRSPDLPVGRLLGWGVVLMVLGYAFSCPTTLYDMPPEQRAIAPKLAPSPVALPTEQLQGRTLSSLLAEPPFVPPPPDPQSVKPGSNPTKLRQWNYWMMSQRAGTLSYLTFGAGFSLAVYAFFLLVCDGLGLQLGVFRTLGVNALAGYILHEMTGSAVKAFTPGDAPMWYVRPAFLTFFAITYLFLRHLEKSRIFLRL